MLSFEIPADAKIICDDTANTLNIRHFHFGTNNLNHLKRALARIFAMGMDAQRAIDTQVIIDFFKEHPDAIGFEIIKAIQNDHND